MQFLLIEQAPLLHFIGKRWFWVVSAEGGDKAKRKEQLQRLMPLLNVVGKSSRRQSEHATVWLASYMCRYIIMH